MYYQDIPAGTGKGLKNRAAAPLLIMFFAASSSFTYAVQTYSPASASISIPSGYTQMLMPAFQGKINTTSVRDVMYPSAIQNMQFMAFRNPTTNQILYVQTQDPNAQVTEWKIAGNGSYTLTLTTQTLTGNLPANFYITDNSMTATTDTAFYRNVARKYKAWAINQKWAKRKISKFDSMVTMAIAPNLQTSTMTGVTQPFIDGWGGENTACWVTFWRRWWQLGLDGGVPDYQLTSDSQASTSLNWMNTHNCSSFPYMNALLWDANNVNNSNYGTTPTYGTNGAIINGTEPAAYNEIVARNPAVTYDASIMIKNSSNTIEELSSTRSNMKYVCQGTSKWKTTFQNAAQSVASSGWKGIYYDMGAFAEPKLCYDANHGHDIADPLVWTSGIRQILTTMRTNNTTKDLMIITEGNAEVYMDLVDAFLSYGDTGLDDASSSKQVPLFKEVYGEIARFISWQALPVANPEKTINDLTSSMMANIIKKSANYGSMFYGAPYFIGWSASYDVQNKLRSDANYASLFDLINNPQYKRSYERGGGAINWAKNGTGGSPAALNTVDTETGAAAIQFAIPVAGNGESYQLPLNETSMFQVSWDMKMTGNYFIDFVVTGSDNNTYYMVYDQNARSFRSTVSNYIKVGVGADSTASGGGQWHTIRRDLAADFQDGLPNPKPTLVKVNNILVLGTGLFDNLVFSNSPTVYEGGSGLVNWTVVGMGIAKSTVYDSETLSDVIQFSGMTNRDKGQYYTHPINDNQHFDIAWDLKTSQNYYVLITVSADDGTSWNLLYDQNARDSRDTVSPTVKVGLGADTIDGKWHTFRRNLADDLFEGTGKNINQVVSMRFYVNGAIDNVLLWGNGIRTSGK